MANTIGTTASSLTHTVAAHGGVSHHASTSAPASEAGSSPLSDSAQRQNSLLKSAGFTGRGAGLGMNEGFPAFV